MFEDSTFESACRIHTRSRNWIIATSGFNGSILLALVMIPLLYPRALPQMTLPFVMAAPLTPLPEPKTIERIQHVDFVKPQMNGGQLFAPPVIPKTWYVAQTPETFAPVNPANMEDPNNSAANNLFPNQNQHPIVREVARGPFRVSGMVVEGLLIYKTIPAYPPIALASRTQGTVVLQAAISRNGTIENLHVVSGPAMLQRAALDAVKSWIYRPYLLSGEPVEVETTINVVFKLQD